MAPAGGRRCGRTSGRARGDVAGRRHASRRRPRGRPELGSGPGALLNDEPPQRCSLVGGGAASRPLGGCWPRRNWAAASNLTGGLWTARGRQNNGHLVRRFRRRPNWAPIGPAGRHLRPQPPSSNLPGPKSSPDLSSVGPSRPQWAPVGSSGLQSAERSRPPRAKGYQSSRGPSQDKWAGGVPSGRSASGGSNLGRPTLEPGASHVPAGL